MGGGGSSSEYITYLFDGAVSCVIRYKERFIRMRVFDGVSEVNGGTSGIIGWRRDVPPPPLQPSLPARPHPLRPPPESCFRSEGAPPSIHQCLNNTSYANTVVNPISAFSLEYRHLSIGPEDDT